MSFWISAVFLTILTLLALVRPLWQRASSSETAGEKDLKVFRDQMKSLDADVARGLVNEADAETTRIEIGRRMLDADRRMSANVKTAVASERTNLVLGTGIAVLIAGLSFGLYSMLGTPGYDNQPLAKRLSNLQEERKNRPSQAEAEANQPKIEIDADQNYLNLVAQLRKTIEGRPDDIQGLKLLATHEARLANFAAARTAQEKLIELHGDNVPLAEYVNLTEIMVLAAGGYVSPESEAILVKVLKADPRDPRGRYYSGLYLAQSGRPDVAYRMWSGLLEEGPENAPWVKAIRQDIVAVARAAGVSLSPTDLPGPSAADVTAAQDMGEDERQDMIRSMVSGLSERLATEGGTPAEWARLIRAYGVLGETGLANEIWQEAQQVFGKNAEAIALLREAARAAEIAN